ncbi:hypothetical protein MIDIC_140010 [Alphaproteobacteria bacterium]
MLEHGEIARKNGEKILQNPIKPNYSNRGFNTKSVYFYS